LDSISFDLNKILENLSAITCTAAKGKDINALYDVEPYVPRYCTDRQHYGEQSTSIRRSWNEYLPV